MKTGAGQSIHAAHTAARHGGVGRSRGRGIFRLIRGITDTYCLLGALLSVLHYFRIAESDRT